MLLNTSTLRMLAFFTFWLPYRYPSSRIFYELTSESSRIKWCFDLFSWRHIYIMLQIFARWPVYSQCLPSVFISCHPPPCVFFYFWLFPLIPSLLHAPIHTRTMLPHTLTLWELAFYTFLLSYHYPSSNILYEPTLESSRIEWCFDLFLMDTYIHNVTNTF